MTIIQHPAADPTMRMLSAYERMGWHLAAAKGKRPIGKQWPDKAVCSASQAAVWLDKGHNLALVTGSRSGIVVIDVDPRNGGTDSLGAAQAEYGALPETLTSKTGGGGLHLVYRYFDGARSGKPLDGIDFQADRRCIIVPPSMHPDTGALYQWASDPATTPVADLPSQWQQAMTGAKPAPEAFADDGGPIPEGKRNSTLFDLARHLYGKGESESTVIVTLTEHNHLHCDPPIDDAEVRAIARNAYRYKPTQQSHLTRFEQCVSRSDMPRDQWCVAMALATYADVNGRKCYPTQGQIAERARYSVPKVKQATAELEAAGWIKRFKLGRDGAGWHYSYHLLIPPIE